MERKSFIQKITSKIKPGFWLYFAIYTLVLVIAAMFFLIYTENSLNEYEASQANHVAERYSESVKESALSGQLPKGVSIPEIYSTFQLEDSFIDDYCKQFSKDTKMTVEKKKDSYDTTAPIFEVFADKVKVAEIQLKAKNTETVFAILSVSDWNIVSFTPVIDGTDTESKVSITVLSTHKVYINGVLLEADYKVKENVAIEEFDTFEQYLTKKVQLTEYSVPKLVTFSGVTIQTEDGRDVSYTPDAQGNIYATYTEKASDVPSDYSGTAMNIAKTWDNFFTNDLPGNGLATVRKYLINGSAFYEQVEIYKNGDAWMVSNHLTANNKYVEEQFVKDYVRYSDECFSCHIKFKKEMILTRTGEKAYTDVNSIFYFVNYDDTNDGVQNPTWKMVAMVGVAES